MGRLLFMMMFLGGGVLWVWMVVECAVKEPSGSDKIVWILVVLLGGCVGAGIYLIVRRPRRIAETGQ